METEKEEKKESRRKAGCKLGNENKKAKREREREDIDREKKR